MRTDDKGRIRRAAFEVDTAMVRLQFALSAAKPSPVAVKVNELRRRISRLIERTIKDAK